MSASSKSKKRNKGSKTGAKLASRSAIPSTAAENEKGHCVFPPGSLQFRWNGRDCREIIRTPYQAVLQVAKRGQVKGYCVMNKPSVKDIEGKSGSSPYKSENKELPTLEEAINQLLPFLAEDLFAGRLLDRRFNRKEYDALHGT